MKMAGRYPEELMKQDSTPAIRAGAAVSVEPAARGDDEAGPASRWRVADLLLDTRRQRLWRGADEIPLPKLTYDLFATLVRRSPDVISDEDLMKAVWPGLIVSPETVSQRVKLLRAALGDESRTPRYVGRLRGRGYFLVPSAQPVGADARQAPSPERSADAVLELSLMESDDPMQPLTPDWAVTHVLPVDVAAGLTVPAESTPPDRPPERLPLDPRQGRVPTWLSWALIVAAILITGMAVAVIRAA
jgi:DNA-binding winged helix-turn-helix (wHTH) protein